MKKLIFILIGILLATNLAVATAADHTYHWLCLERGEELPGYDHVCDGWCCFYCVDEVGNINPHGCGSAQMCSCGGNVDADIEPPEMIVHSPENDAVYSSRAINVEVEMPGEQASVYVKNNNKLGANYYRICHRDSHCERIITVDEGSNSWSFKAEDYFGNPTYETREFTVDSRPPVISSTWPRAGEYASKTFGVRYTEQAMQSVTLYYKQGGAYTQVPGTECLPGRNMECEITVPGMLLQGGLDYHFCVADSATEVCSDDVHVQIDTEAPDLDVLEPIQDEVYNTRRVPFNINTDEPVTLSYMDLSLDVPRERRICANCMGTQRPQTFTDGPHNLLIMALDKAGNPAQQTREFTVDSRPPRITRTSPRANAYGNGEFEVSYSELNPVRVSVFYKQAGTFQSVDAGYCNGGARESCKLLVPDLSQGDLEYYFEIEDVAGEIAKSRTVTIHIDTVKPVMTVTKPDQALYNTRNVPFDISVVDQFPVTLSYVDAQTGREIALARAVKQFSRSRSFTDGLHDITIIARDPSGNTDEYEWEFRVDSRPPRLIRYEPRNGAYGDGSFTAMYNELNPDTLTLWYKEYGDTAFTPVPKSNCPGGPYEKCTITVEGISDGEVEYYFSLSDVAGEVAEQRTHYTVTVDTEAPGLDVLSPESTEYLSRSVRFTMHSTEPVKLEYIDHESSSGWRRLASGVTDYSRQLGFAYGQHDVQVRATDSAGNENLSEHILFEVINPYS